MRRHRIQSAAHKHTVECIRTRDNFIHSTAVVAAGDAENAVFFYAVARRARNVSLMLAPFIHHCQPPWQLLHIVAIINARALLPSSRSYFRHCFVSELTAVGGRENNEHRLFPPITTRDVRHEKTRFSFEKCLFFRNHFERIAIVAMLTLPL